MAPGRGIEWFGRWTLLVGTVAISAVAVVAMVSTSLAVAGLGALEVAPSLPDPGVDVSAIDDLAAVVARADSQPSIVVDSRGEVIGRFVPESLHRALRADEIPETIELALVAAEDENFFRHAGYDPKALLRAAASNLTSGSVEEGGSTLTQQLAKNLFTGDEDSFERKLVELQVAVDLEARFSKREILAAYVNSVFLGNGAYGFEAAARTYFGTTADQLTLSQAALLVGVLPAPTTRDPRAHFDAAEAARRRVLHRMAEVGDVSAAEVAEAVAEVPEILPPPPRVERWPYYVDYVRRYLLDDAGLDPELLYSGGLTIETALVPELQYAARLAVAEHLPAADSGPEAAVALVDVASGSVVALVGGRRFDEAQVNLALGADGGGTGRQPGSSFKPFVLATALAQGYVLDQKIEAPATYVPRSVPDPKPVTNFSGRGSAPVTLAQATVRSINTSFVSLTEVVGAGAVRQTASDLGVRSLPESVGPSIGIGAYETSPLEMASAYAGFADDGRRVETGPVRRILGPDGEVILDLTPPQRDERPQAVDPQVARRVTATLARNLEAGTAVRARIGRPGAAKTGTSDEYANAWLVGYTPDFAAAVWVGHPEGNIPMRDVAGFARITGGSLPALIWRDVMAAAHHGRPAARFPAPDPSPPLSRLLPGTVFPEPPPPPSSVPPEEPDPEEPSPAP